MAYFTTSYTFDATSTSTTMLLVWRALSRHLERYQKPMTGEELAEATGLDMERIEAFFDTVYYQKHYGFRRFETMAEFDVWAKEHDILFDADKHLVREEPAAAEAEVGVTADAAEESEAE